MNAIHHPHTFLTLHRAEIERRERTIRRRAILAEAPESPARRDLLPRALASTRRSFARRSTTLAPQ